MNARLRVLPSPWVIRRAGDGASRVIMVFWLFAAGVGVGDGL